MKRTKELKDTIIGVKVPKTLVLALDEEAIKESTSRSHIIRRRLINSYSQEAKRELTAVGS